jgi:DNA polymerase III delta prime subunit
MSRNERTTCKELIEPALAHLGWTWDEQLRIGPGRVNLTGDSMYDDSQAIIADYQLRYRSIPLAILEAKAEGEPASDGIQQGSRYAQRLSIRFSIATNGKEWILTDNETHTFETMARPPSPEDIIKRHGVTIDWDRWGGAFAAAYHFDQVNRKKVRPYQDMSIFRTLWTFAQGIDRALLLKATGTGKTFTVFQLIWKMMNGDALPRQHVLFLTDRNSLKDQAFRAFSAFSASERVVIDRETVASGQHSVGKIFFANYQNLEEVIDGKKLYEHYDPDFFDLVVVDECHRSGFGDWFGVFEHFTSALHVYHYAPYEITAMKRLMGKYGTREAEVDSLLRNGVFVDLYRIIRQGMRIGASSYSLKKVEKLYLDPRAGDVQDATASIVFYAQWQESGEAPDWRDSPILKKIRDYNQVDCDSTLLLTEWLRGKQVEHGIPYHPPNEEDRTGGAPKKDAPAPALENMELIRNMLAKLPEEGDERVIGELLAHFVEFHRRDNKPMWWARFERAAMSEEELHDDINCLGGLELEGAPVRDKRSLIATYRFDPDQDSKIATKSKVMPSHELNAKLEVVGLDSNDGRIGLRMSEAALTSKLGGAFPSRLSLIPDEFVSPGVIEQALKELAETWLDSGDIPPCLRRLLLRQPPRVDGVEQGAPLSDVHQAVPAMRESTLAIQGPPGTGKTYTASRLIKHLIESGKRVGITSNSRKAIINLVEGIHSAGADLNGSVYAVSNLADKSLDHIPGIEVTDSGSALGSYKKGIIAGTAWLFCRPEFAAQLDYLFIDEAGQVSLANVAAMSQATRNLVLLGDQNQLPMPTQGTHPGESGLSSLVYLLKGHAVVPPELGVFLGTTYRMHPDVCSFISDCYYEGKLQSAPQAANHKLALPDDPGPVPMETGILFHPVPHTGNTQDSPEEVAAIQEILNSLLGRTFTDSEGRSRPLGLEDILFVSPYNLQVRRMEKSLPAGAKIGSVDRFQGQEAPVVIVSLCSSAGEFGNRGLSFILDRNRLNVALSRAQALAIVVGDPNIANTEAGSIKEMGLLNVFCRIAGTL